MKGKQKNSDELREELFSRYPVLESCRASIIEAYNSLLALYKNGGKLLFALDGRERDGVVLRTIEQAEQKARSEQTDGGFGDLFLGDQPLLKGVEQVVIGFAAVDVAAGAERPEKA